MKLGVEVEKGSCRKDLARELPGRKCRLLGEKLGLFP